MNTVTYGTASNSFLAIRCLKQLGLEYEDKYPKAANILHNFYVDDMLFGTETVESAVTLSRQVDEILETGWKK